VKKILFGGSRARVENPRWITFRSHFRFDAYLHLPAAATAIDVVQQRSQLGQGVTDLTSERVGRRR
jgi:hypothetical protein